MDISDGTVLSTALSIGDLVKGGAKFEINSNFNEAEDDIFVHLEVGEDDDNELYNEVTVSPWDKDFEELKQNMVKLPDYNIYKKIVKEGLRDVPVSEKARVSIHYNAYWEKESMAFDSTYMRGSPKTFNIGCKEVVTGIELAVNTMKEGEESQFLISFELLFGEMGCPPRIQPKATGLFIIQVLKFTETGDENAVDNVNEADKRKYSIVLPKVKEVHMKGLDLFNQGFMYNACRAFHKAVSALEWCQLENQEDQLEQQQFIAKLYTNLAVCYNKLNLPLKTCSMCNEIARVSNISTNCKALFQEGKALLKLGDFKNAQIKLVQAQKLQPTNMDITNELKLLSEKYQAYTTNEKQIWQKAMGHTVTKKQDDNNVSDLFKSAISKYLDDFENNDKQQKMQLPDGLSGDEIVCIEEMIKNMSLKLRVTNIHNKKVYNLIKDI